MPWDRFLRDEVLYGLCNGCHHIVLDPLRFYGNVFAIAYHPRARAGIPHWAPANANEFQN